MELSSSRSPEADWGRPPGGDRELSSPHSGEHMRLGRTHSAFRKLTTSSPILFCSSRNWISKGLPGFQPRGSPPHFPSARNQGRQSIQSPWVHCNPLPTTDPLLLGKHVGEEHSKPHPRAERDLRRALGLNFVSATSNLCDFGLVKKPLCLHFLICKMELIAVSTTQS